MSAFRRALLRWLGQADPDGSDCPIPIPDCRTCRPDPLLTVSSLDPVEVGRQAVRGDAILDVVAWLRANGWQDDAGRLQRYAAWLIEARMAYELTTAGRGDPG